LVRLLRRGLRAQGSAVCLVLEDAHWFDSASWALLGRVSRELDPALILVTTRPLEDLQQRDYRRLVEQRGTLVWQLDDLAPEETLRLACLRLGVSRLPAAVERFILARAEGHPFFIEELCQALSERGWLRIEDGQCHLTVDAQELETADFPRTVDGVVRERVTRLAAGQQVTLKVASVVGRVFPYRVLHDIHPYEEERDRLRSHLEMLDRHQLIRPLDKKLQLTHIFKHALTQQVAYSLLLFTQRADLHRAIARWYERRFKEDLSPHLPLLVHHWSAAEDEKKTLSYLERAGQQALLEGAFQEAADFLGRTLELDARQDQPSPTNRRLRWRRLRADALFSLGQLDRTVEEVAAALEELGGHSPRTPGQWAWACLRELAAHCVLLPMPSLFQVRDAERRARIVEETRLWARVGEAFYFTLDAQGMIASSLRAVNLSLRVGSDTSVSRAFSLLGLISGPSRLNALSEHYFRRGGKLAQLAGNAADLAFSFYSATAYHMGYARWRQALAAAREALSTLAPIQARQDRETALTVRYMSLYWLGRFGEFERDVEEMLASARARDNLQHTGWGHISRARGALRRGSAVRAIAEADRGEEILQRAQDGLAVSIVLGTRAMARLRLGDQEGAVRDLRSSGRSYWGKVPLSVASLDALEGVMEAALATWDHAQRQDAPARAERRSDALRSLKALRLFSWLFPAGRPAHLLYKGRVRELRGLLGGAQRSWRAAQRAAQRLEMPYFEALAAYHQGRVAQEPQRSRLLEQAREIFGRLGCPDQLDWVAKAREGSNVPGYLGAGEEN